MPKKLLLLAALLSAQPLLAEPLAPVLVFYGPSDKKDIQSRINADENAVQVAALDDGLVRGVLATRAFGSVNEESDQTTAIALEESRFDGFADHVASTMGCWGTGDASCRPVVVTGPDTIHASGVSADVADGNVRAVLAKLYLDIQPRSTVYFLRQKTNGKTSSINKLDIWYFDPPEMEGKQTLSPFYPNPGRVTDKQREELAPSRELWFSGDPSPLHTVIDGFVATVPRVLDHLYTEAAGPNQSLDLRTWYSSLDPLKAIAKDHGFNCSNADCEQRFVTIDSAAQQAWVARFYGSDLLIRVVPCDWLWCDAD